MGKCNTALNALNPTGCFLGDFPPFTVLKLKTCYTRYEVLCMRDVYNCMIQEMDL